MYYTFGISNNERDQWHGMNRYSDFQFSSTDHLTISLQNCTQVSIPVNLYTHNCARIYFLSNCCGRNRIKVYLILALRSFCMGMSENDFLTVT